jgi:Holliday junction resolvase RusA-like endonuclease
MNTEIVLRVDGKPTGKGRPRFDPRSKRTYTDAKTRLAEARVIETWINAGRPRLPDGPARMTVVITVARPQNHWKVNGTLSAAGQRSAWPVRKPDADNALKLIMDALNGCAYRDDVDVVHAWVLRRWASATEHEHVVINLAPMAAPIS